MYFKMEIQVHGIDWNFGTWFELQHWALTKRSNTNLMINKNLVVVVVDVVNVFKT